MNQYIGRKIAAGFGKESVRGTAVAATDWYPHLSLDFEEKIQRFADDGARGTIAKESDGHVLRKWAEGGMTGNLYDRAIGLLLYNLLGTLNTAANADASGNVYDHTFTLAETNQHQSLTINTDEANGDYRFANAMLEELTINYEQEKLIDFSGTFMSKKGASETNTVAYSAAENAFRPQDVIVKFASTAAGLGAASATVLKAMSLTIKKNLNPFFVLGSVDPADIFNTQFEVSGELTFLFNDETIKDLALAGTKQAMRIDMINTGVTIGTAANPQLQIDLNQLQFEEFNRDKPIADIVMATLPFSAAYSLTDAKMIEILLTNLVVSY